MANTQMRPLEIRDPTSVSALVIVQQFGQNSSQKQEQRNVWQVRLRAGPAHR